MRALTVLEDLAPVVPPGQPSRWEMVRRVMDVAFYETVLAGTFAGLVGEALFGGWVRVAALAVIGSLFLTFIFSTYRAGTRAWADRQTGRGIYFVLLALPFTLLLCLTQALNAGFSNPCVTHTACTFDLSLPFVAFSVSAILFAVASALTFLAAPAAGFAALRYRR